MQDVNALIILFFVDLGGALARAVYPWIQTKMANEQTLRSLQLIPADKLTDEQKAFLNMMNQPLNFSKFYMFTSIAGFIATAVTVLSGFTALMSVLPADLSTNAVMGFMPLVFLAGWGGGSVSNQLLKSKNTATSNADKMMVTHMLASTIGSAIATAKPAEDVAATAAGVNLASTKEEETPK